MFWNVLLPGADPENCFGRGTLDLSRRRRRSETPNWALWGGDVWAGALPTPQPTRGLGERRKPPFPQWGLGRSPAAVISGHYIRNFVRFHACFGAFWNLTGKANKTDPIRPLVPANGLEGARAPCAPVWIRPCLLLIEIITPEISFVIFWTTKPTV